MMSDSTGAAAVPGANANGRSGLDDLAAADAGMNAPSLATDLIQREQAAAAAAAAAVVPTTPNLWPLVDPSVTLKVLQKLEEKDLPKGKDGSKGKALAKSYTTWDKCNTQQKNKILAFFTSLTTEVKTRVAEEATSIANVAAEGESSRAEITTKDDRCRLGMYCINYYVLNSFSQLTRHYLKISVAHLSMQPELQPLWTAAGTPLDRAKLDARNSTGAEDPWDKLAEAFNDYDLYPYRNVTIRPQSVIESLTWQAASGMEALAAVCYELNPCIPTRPTRNGAWLRKLWGQMRSMLTAIRLKYKASGNQEAGDEYAEWIKFAQNYGEVACYAIAVIPLGSIDELGRALPDNAQRDTAGRSDNTFLTCLSCSYLVLSPNLTRCDPCAINDGRCR